jgi:hypothetical protein
VAGSCEHGNEVSVTMKGEEFLDQLSDYQLRSMQSGTGCCEPVYCHRDNERSDSSTSKHRYLSKSNSRFDTPNGTAAI